MAWSVEGRQQTFDDPPSVFLESGRRLTVKIEYWVACRYNVRSTLGQGYIFKQNFVGTLIFRSQALARDESHWSAWHGLGQVKNAQGKHADAVEALSKWLEGQENGGNGREGEYGVSGGGVVAGESGRGGGGGARGARGATAAMAKGLVQLGDAHRKLGQVRENPSTGCFF